MRAAEFNARKRVEDLPVYRAYRMPMVSRDRARMAGLERQVAVTIIRQDVRDLCREVCPVLGIPLDYNKSDQPAADSPSIDKIVPERRYVLANIAVISYRASRIKGAMTGEELRNLARWMRSRAGAQQRADTEST